MKLSAIVFSALAVSVAANYVPTKVDCPSDVNLTRKADGLSAQEAKYIASRHTKATESLRQYLKPLDIKARGNSSFDVDAFLNQSSPRLAVAAAGGGLRATLTGAGVMAALDNRVDSSSKVGGFLQATEYMSGLSGGSWLVGHMALSDLITGADLAAALSRLFKLPGSMGTLGILTKVIFDTTSKHGAGYQTSVTDQWGRLIYYMCANAGLNSSDPTWSGIKHLDSFTSFDMPFPIILGTTLFPGTSFDVTTIGFNNSIVEMTPYEWGTWDRNVRHFVDTEYLGTSFENGKPTGQCTTGYDNAGFLLGTSSNVFNSPLADLGFEGILGILLQDLIKALEVVNLADYELGVYENPFYKLDGISSNQTISKGMYVCDGGFDLETIPILPFLQPEREVDVVVAIDPSTDTADGWPNGAALRNTLHKSNWEFGPGVFPNIPDNDTFINDNLTARPIFFGCNTTSLKTYKDSDRHSPVIVYVPIIDLTYPSNFSTGKLIYSEEELWGSVTNGYNVMTQLNGTANVGWDKCLGCVSLLREFQRRDSDVPNDCEQCFSDYCYN